MLYEGGHNRVSRRVITEHLEGQVLSTMGNFLGVGPCQKEIVLAQSDAHLAVSEVVEVGKFKYGVVVSSAKECPCGATRTLWVVAKR